MAAHISLTLKTVGERGLQNHRTRVPFTPGNLPDTLGRACISNVEQSFFVILDEKGGAWNDVIDSDHSHD